MEHHSTHTVFSIKMIIGYLDSLFADTRRIMTNAKIYKMVPRMLAERYSELEYQYAYVERVGLNFYNLIYLKRHIETVWKHISVVGEKYAESFPEARNELSGTIHVPNDYKSISQNQDSVDLGIKWKKEILDCDFSELELDPQQLKDREVMENLRKYRLVKVSKLSVVYDMEYLVFINSFLACIHHVSEFTLKARDINHPIPLHESTTEAIVKIYGCTYEQFELKGLALNDNDWGALGVAFNKNRNNLTVNMKSWWFWFWS
jgi:hypothetical protein